MNSLALSRQGQQASGCSRFSKALPAPPPIDTSSYGLPTNPKSPLSPAPSSAVSSRRANLEYSKPLDSPLPPLPLSTPKTTPPKMAIPRKPIGLPASPMPNRMNQQQLQQHQPTQDRPQADPLPLTPPPPPQKENVYGSSKDAQEVGVHSPTFSFSSLLSAYTATSTNSAVRSDSGSDSRVTSTRNSDASGSPNQDEEATGDTNTAAQGRQHANFPPRKDSRSYKTSVSSSSFATVATPMLKDKSLPAPPPRTDSLRRPHVWAPAESMREQEEYQLLSQPQRARQQDSDQQQDGKIPTEEKEHQQQQKQQEPQLTPPQSSPAQVSAQAASDSASADAGILHTQANPGSSLLGLNGASSSPRRELWRRRSTKTDKNLALPELKLETTNGSTASPRQLTAPGPSLEHSSTGPSGSSAQPPKSSNALPGRNIRPVATRPAPAPPVQHQNRPLPGVSEQMGQSTSRIRRKSVGLGTAPVAKSQQNGSSPNKAIQSNISLTARPPTPEYQKNDVRSPVVETVMSPASPASSPEPTRAPQAPAIPKQSIRRRPVASPTSPEPVSPTTVSSTIRPAKSSSSLKVSPVSSPSESTSPSPELVPTLAEVHRAGASPQVEDPSEKATARPALTHHMAVVLAAVKGQPMAEEPAPAAGAPPNATTGRLAGCNAFTDGPIAPGTILDSTPLTTVHYQCFKQHRQFRQSPNINYPLTCQTCHRRDTEMRWRCNWCALRICRTCLDMLMASNRDLNILEDKVSHFRAQLSAVGGDQEFGRPVYPEPMATLSIPLTSG